MKFIVWFVTGMKPLLKINVIIVFLMLFFLGVKQLLSWLTPEPIAEKITGCIQPFHLSCTQWCAQFSPVRVKFTISLLVGLLIISFLYIFDDLRPVREFEDWGADLFINTTVNTAPDKTVVPYAVLDIDDVTFDAWHEPFFTPRNQLLTLIKTAVESNAKVVIVDIGLHRKGDAYFDSLMTYLKSYDRQCTQRIKNKQQTCPPIILMRSFVLDKKNKQYPTVKPAPGVLENIVSQSAHIHWSSSLYDLSKDQLVRYWNLWQPVCLVDGGGKKTQVLPSVQLLALILATSDHPSQAYATLMSRLEKLAPPSCQRLPENVDQQATIHPITLDGVQIDFDQGHVSKRVFYSIPWHGSTAHTQDGAFLLRIIPANLITKMARPQPLKQIENRITIIGASHRESGDLHTTPLAQMSGSMVIINAIHSLQQFGDVAAPNAIIVFLIQFLLIVAISVLYAKLPVDSSWIGFIGLCMVALLLPFSMWMIGHGIWLDFALPLFAVQLYQIAFEFYEDHPFKKEHDDA